MPQPLRKWVDDIHFSHLELAKNPELTAGIATVATAWSEVDVELGLLLAVMLGTQAVVGVSMYVALAGSPAQRSTLAAAGEAVLPDNLKAKLAALLEEMRARAKERNAVVHALWSLHPKNPDQIVRCSPEHLVLLVAQSAAKAIETYEAMFEVLSDTPPQQFVDGLQTYTAKDFENIVGRIEKFRGEVAELGHEIGKHLDTLRPPLTHGLIPSLRRVASKPPPEDTPGSSGTP